jgi:hypothetical protein
VLYLRHKLRQWVKLGSCWVSFPSQHYYWLQLIEASGFCSICGWCWIPPSQQMRETLPSWVPTPTNKHPQFCLC